MIWRGKNEKLTKTDLNNCVILPPPETLFPPELPVTPPIVDDDEGEKFIGFVPACVWRRVIIDIGFEASFADEDLGRPGPDDALEEMNLKQIRYTKNNRNDIQIIQRSLKNAIAFSIKRDRPIILLYNGGVHILGDLRILGLHPEFACSDRTVTTHLHVEEAVQVATFPDRGQ